MTIIAKYKFLIFAIFLSLVAVFSLFSPGLPPTHDGEYHVVRFYEFSKVIGDGNLYPRWAPDLNNGFGTPLFNYVYPLPNYFAFFLHLLGVSFIDSFKISLIAATVLGAGFFYLWARIFWGNLGGLVSSVFYTFSPYHLLDIYIRGSVGEAWALAIFPAFLWAITVYIKTKKKGFLPLSALTFALLIFSHNILALMFSSFSLFYIGYLIYKEKQGKEMLVRVGFIVLLGLSLSSVFWLPALLERSYVVGLEIYNVASNFPLLYELLIPTWGSGFSEGSLGDKLSFQMGVANLLAVFGSLIMLVLSKKRDGNKSWVIFFILWFFFVFFLMLKSSQFIWEKIPLMSYFQFPWRLLSLEILICSFLAGGIVYFGKTRKILTGVLISIAILLGIGYAKPAHFLNRDDAYYITRSNFIDGTNSPGNTFNTTWFKGMEKNKNKIDLIVGNADIEVTSMKSSNYLAEIEAQESSKILVNIAYFPGWAAYVNGKRTEIQQTEEGLFYLDVPKGKHDVEIKLENTPTQKTGVVGFFASAIVLLVLFSRAIFVTLKK